MTLKIGVLFGFWVHILCKHYTRIAVILSKVGLLGIENTGIGDYTGGEIYYAQYFSKTVKSM